MASNILFLPFRRTHSVSLSTSIRQYISTKYDQHPDMFIRDMDAIEKMRTDAVNTIEAHTSGIRKLTAYAAQLVWMGGKFPIDVLSQNNLRFELVNVLFNLASLYSQLAVSLNRTTSDGLKSACNYFCQAAGVISHIKTVIIPDMRSSPPEDMDTMTLESIQQLLLAQAQECFWSKAVKDGLKDGLIAKLAAKVSDFYDQAAEYGTKSDIISTEWIHHMTAKQHHFAAAAQYRASRDCLDKQNYGEEVARLRDSLNCVNEALKESRWINKIVLGDLNGLKSRVSEDLKRAEKDNDIIYLMPVPPKSELKTLDRAGMATARVPQEVSDPSATLGEGGIYGQPLFAKLVPYAVHIAASIYEERKNRIVNVSVIEVLEGLTNQLKDLLQSLNLPGSLQALEKPLGLPPSLAAHAEEIRQQDGLHRLRRSMHETSKLKANDTTIYQEGVDVLRSEAAEDDRAKLKHGTDRWNRQPSQKAAEKLYAQVSEIDGYLKSASSSDELVETKLKECEKALTVLSGSDRDIEEYVPSSRRAVMPPNVQQAAGDLRSMLNEVNQLGSRRKKQIEKMRNKAKQDDINQVILAETARLEREFPMQKIEPAQFENLFEERLERYEEDQKLTAKEKEEQDPISTQLRQANAAFANARKGDTSTREREQALQRLENAYVKYKEIISNLNTGRKFYNDLAKIVNRFRDDCKNFAYQRRVEAGQLESDLSNAMSALNLSQATSLQDQKQRESLRSHYNAKAPSSEPLTAPMPTRAAVQPPTAPAPGMWNPEMGIKFGGVTTPQQPPANGNVHSPAYPSTRARGGQWDANQGLRFG
ncbi:pH-response regulator protein palA/rim20 [Imshaugia aleurites]|uniref:PH-response regulator protein palA/rim20 n=1 Tax=Imshaugia aleurites TaxID=172621 RepID=A0A8H3I484_9LECA|nr:pH-response regulator protein palA/rim20 [Imshaugia aleurites]